MSFLNEWSYSVCITLIISVIISLLLPKGTTGKFAKTIVMLFITASFLLPLKNFDVFNSFDTDSIFLQAQDDVEQSSYADIIRQNIVKTLENGGYYGCAVAVDIDVDGADGEIEIEEVTVSLPDEYDAESIKSYIFEKMGINAEVYCIGE